ncbi:MAG: thiolase family protein [Planctomycetales bacterium]
MREAVIVDSCRTALCKSFRGSFNMTRSDDLAGHAIAELMKRVPQLNPAEIEDVILGCGFPEGPQGMNVARIAALRAGLPVTNGAMTVNRFCSSGLQAIALAAHEVLVGEAEAVMAGGVESITATFKAKIDPNPVVAKEKPGIYMVMGETAEVVAKKYNVSRQAQDEYSVSSQQRTGKAQAEGFFKQEIVPMKVTRALLDKQGQVTGTEETVADKDECNRPDTTLEGLAGLKPYFDPNSGQGSVTAGNASQLSDGASATLVMSRERAEQLGIKPKLIFRGFAIAGCEPEEMGIGPIYAVPKLLKRHNLSVKDIDLWELNEAFAVQVLYCRDFLGIDQNKLNVNGGSIAIGHPYGMTGSRMVGTLANEMHRRKVRYGVVTMCIGGGQGAAGLFELYPQ